MHTMMKDYQMAEIRRLTKQIIDDSRRIIYNLHERSYIDYTIQSHIEDYMIHSLIHKLQRVLGGFDIRMHTVFNEAHEDVRFLRIDLR
jgi:predicted translin family RNA/ssDNA-binding protein